MVANINRNLSFPPWVYFLFFLLNNILLSCFTLSLQVKLWVLLLGLALPFGLGLFVRRPLADHPDNLMTLEFLPPIRTWIWVLLGVFALFVRFYKLTSLSVWPNGDEGSVIYVIFQMMRNGVERFFYVSQQIPPFYPWWLNIQFKLWGPSLANFWFWPAFFSALAVPMTYLAARQFFSRSFSFFCVLMMAFCFWFLYAGRFSHHLSLFPFVETWIFFLLGKFWKADKSRQQFIMIVALGFNIGLVFYAIYLHWIIFAAMITLTVAWKTRHHLKLLAAYGITLGLTLLPFVVLAAKAGFPHNIGYLFKINPEISLSYLKIIFWGVPPTYYSYQPVWGGFLNPILGALCLLGLLEAVRNIRKGFHIWLILAFGIFLLPGMLSRDSEVFRIFPILGTIIPLTALGTASLAFSFPSKWVVTWLLILFLPSIGMDFYHLAGPYHRLWDSPDYWAKSVKSINSYRAYLILKEKASTDGPGMVFSDLTPNNLDQTLSLATFPFDLLSDRKRPFQDAKWAALLINVHYQPFLLKRFGIGKTYFLSKDIHFSDGGRMLWVFPLENSNTNVIRRWCEADLSLDEFLKESFQGIDYFWGYPSTRTQPALEKVYPFFKNDFFLESCFWEKMADLQFKHRRLADAIESLHHAVEKGYPAAHLYNRLGVLYLIQGKLLEARQAYKKALQAPFDFTDSEQQLKQLQPPRPLARKITP
jgi:hypothetical protein